MARRKVLYCNGRKAAITPLSLSMKDLGSTREYYNRRYNEVDKKRRSTGLYEDSTKCHRDRMKVLWREYVVRPHL